MTSTAALIHRRPRIVHDHNWRGGLLWVLVACLALGLLDAWDNEAYWRDQANRANKEVARRNSLESLPNPAIVLDARTAEKFGVRLAEIAGGLDGVRAEMRRGK